MSTASQTQLDRQYEDDRNLRARIELHTRFSTNSSGWARWVFEQLPLRRARRILELGCGAAELWVQNRHRLPAAVSVLLSDRSLGMISTARQQLAQTAPQFSSLAADAQALPCAEARFDGVVANHMLYHLADRPRALAEIARVLVPGGWLAATTNGGRHLQELGERVTNAGIDASAWATLASVSFSLENGAAQLAPFFSRVEVVRYDDALYVTEVEPLVAYVRSMMMASLISADATERLREAAAADIARSGGIPISKESGLFLARV